MGWSRPGRSAISRWRGPRRPSGSRHRVGAALRQVLVVARRCRCCRYGRSPRPCCRDSCSGCCATREDRRCRPGRTVALSVANRMSSGIVTTQFLAGVDHRDVLVAEPGAAARRACRSSVPPAMAPTDAADHRAGHGMAERIACRPAARRPRPPTTAPATAPVLALAFGSAAGPVPAAFMQPPSASAPAAQDQGGVRLMLRLSMALPVPGFGGLIAESAGRVGPERGRALRPRPAPPPRRAWRA